MITLQKLCVTLKDEVFLNGFRKWSVTKNCQIFCVLQYGAFFTTRIILGIRKPYFSIYVYVFINYFVAWKTPVLSLIVNPNLLKKH